MKKFRDLEIGDVIELASGETAKVLSPPGPTMARYLMGVDIMTTDGELVWFARHPDTDVVVRNTDITEA